MANKHTSIFQPIRTAIEAMNPQVPIGIGLSEQGGATGSARTPLDIKNARRFHTMEQLQVWSFGVYVEERYASGSTRTIALL